MSKFFFVLLALAALIALALAHLYFSSDCVAVQNCRLSASVPLSEKQKVSASKLSDFSSLELALARLKFDASGEVVLDPSAESILSSASAALKKAPTAQQWQAINELVEKSFPARRSSMLFALLQSFDGYFRAATKLMEAAEAVATNDSDEAPLQRVEEELVQQEKREHLQLQYLGTSVATALYARQNALARKLLALRSLELDPALSEAEKRRRAEVVEAELARLMSESEG